MKTCTKCGEEKELSEFSKHKRTKDGRDYWCRCCHRISRELRVKSNPNSYRINHYKYSYGLTVVQVAELFAGGCAICGTKTGKLCIDHCHETNVVRGCLCSRHNSALGALGDNIAGLMRAVTYLGGVPSENL